MALLAIDLGGTKLAVSIFSESGKLSHKKNIHLAGRSGNAVGALIAGHIREYLNNYSVTDPVNAIGIAVPGIYSKNKGTVWAPNISGWEQYPLLNEIKAVAGGIPVTIDSDRACYILGEVWRGNAKGCSDAIFLAVGTGIGAGIMTGGNILRGSHDIAGAIGWMALEPPFKDKFISCGCFEHYASGAGIGKIAREKLSERNEDNQMTRNKQIDEITAHDVFEAYEKNEPLATEIVAACIQYWGMAVANLVSLFNPEKIIMGGGIFGPAVKLLPAIVNEAFKWAQPVSIQQVAIESTALGDDAGLYGAACLALKSLSPKRVTNGL